MPDERPVIRWGKWELVGIDPDGAMHFWRKGSTDSQWTREGYTPYKAESRCTVPADIVRIIRESALTEEQRQALKAVDDLLRSVHA